MPWRDEESEVLDVDAEVVFQDNSYDILQRKKEFCKLDDETLDGYLETLENDGREAKDLNDEEEEEENSIQTERSLPENRLDDCGRYVLEIDDSNEGDYHQTTDLEDELNPSGARSDPKSYLEKINVPGMLPTSEYENLINSLNLKQRLYLTHLINHVRYNHSVEGEESYKEPEMTRARYSQFFHFVTGGAGVGKSKLIEAIYQSLVREFDKDRDRDMSTPSVLLCAPTGKAAFLIKGQTLHTAFQLPVSQRGSDGLTHLSSEIASSMKNALKDLRVIIIDEISMVGTSTFSWVDSRLRSIFSFDHKKPFGGKSIIVFGDFLQLPPVMASPLYSTRLSRSENQISSLFTGRLWPLFQVHKLDQIMRQRDDLQFAIALNNMATGTMTNEDINLIQSRVIQLSRQDLDKIAANEITLVPSSSLISNGSSIHLFHSNERVTATNNQVLTSLNSEGAVSVAFDRVTGSCKNQTAINRLLYRGREEVSLAATMGLAKSILLKVGGKYMITTNVNTADGLVNGVTGILKRIDYGRLEADRSNTLSTKKPLRIWVELDEERAGREARRQQSAIRRSTAAEDIWTMIVPHTTIIRRNSKSNIQLHRTQFPVVAAEALTIHKSQGGTYDHVAVYDCGNRKLCRSLLYVACSRSTTANGLSLVCKNNAFLPPKPLADDPSCVELRQELERHTTCKLALSFEALINCENTSKYKIISHNVQSLRAHIQQIRNDHVYLSCDIILLSETWTVDNMEEYTIEGFTLVSRADGPSSQPRPVGCCCFVKNSVLNMPVTSHSQYLTDGYNNSSVSISMFSLGINTFCSIYCSPNHSISLLQQALDVISSIATSNLIIAGDFNIHFNKESPKRTTLESFMLQYNLESPFIGSTFTTTKKCTFIDNIFTDKQVFNSARYISFTSYHEPLYMQISQ
jgi:exonuclease III